MACEKCRDYEGDSTTHFSELEKLFEIEERIFGFTTESGTARCRFCGQEVEYFLDVTLIPKMRIKFGNRLASY